MGTLAGSWPNRFAVLGWLAACAAVVAWYRFYCQPLQLAPEDQTTLQTFSMLVRSFIVVVLPWVGVALFCHVWSGFVGMRIRSRNNNAHVISPTRPPARPVPSLAASKTTPSPRTPSTRSERMRHVIARQHATDSEEIVG